MRKRARRSTVAALALFAAVGLVAALAIAWPNVARAHETGFAYLSALTVTAGGGTALTLSPAFSSTVADYTVSVADTVNQVTIEATPDSDGTVAYQNTDGTTLMDADTNTAGQQVDIPAVGDKSINVVVTHTDSGSTTTQTYTVLVSREETDAPCDGGGYNPTPTPVVVAAVPIVVDSTTADYFVLYVTHDVGGTEVEVPVLVKKGAVGTTTLAENIAALPADRYRVEKYLIADPADVDGDCIGDIIELDSLGSMNPVNSAGTTELIDGAVAIPDRATFETLTFGALKFVLLGMDTDRPSVYFLNTHTHPAHRDFLSAVGIDRDQPGIITGWITDYGNPIAPDGSRGVYAYHLSRAERFSLVDFAYTVFGASVPLLEDDLAYYVSEDRLRHYQDELALYEQSRVDPVFIDDIRFESNFIALNKAEGYGFLRVMDLDERPNPRDVVLYEALPNELPRVAGIITSVPQTPLSHVNLRAIQDGVPNAFIRDALDEPEINALIDRYVYYTVTEGSYTLRAATKEEVDNHYASSRPAQPQTPQRDLSVTTITPLSEIGFADWDAFGVKAANVAELRKLDFPEGTVPDGFAIPFYFYDEFMKHNGFYDDIQALLDDEDFQTDLDTQEKELKKLRKAIEDAKTPGWIIDALVEMNKGFPEGINRRYRSSTNNEDLPGFNGAGLYDSKSQKPDEDEEDLAKSLKEVYASLWNFRAFSERDFHRIDHLKAAMGVLVHPSYQDELVNGVAVTFDPAYGSIGTYYLNSQIGEDLVTNPDALSVPEEILLRRVGYTVIDFSNQVRRGQLLMTDAQLNQLREHLRVIHDEFKKLYNPGPDEPFAMEIEFKITSDNVLAIKQARPWVFGDAERYVPPPALTNQAPMFTNGASTTRSVAETSTAGRSIGAPVVATDADNDALTYSLGGTDAASFDIVTLTGQLLTKAALNYATRNSYSVTVSVHDGKNDDGDPDTAIDATTRVTINVTTTTTRSGGSGGGRRRATPTPTPTPTPTQSPTPTATPTPTGPQFSGVIAAGPSVTATVVPEGTTLGLNGGGDLPGGVYVNFPPTAVALPVHVSVSVSNEAPDDVTAPSGTTLLPLTINIAPETPLTLGEPLTIEINPTPEQLEAAGGDLNNLAVGVVTPHGIVVLPTQVLHGRLVVTTDRLAPFVLVAITDTGPVLRQPPMGDASSMGPLLQWTQPPRTTWFQVQVIPFNEDGPGINLVIGDGALVEAAQYQVLGPNFGSADPNYVMLPDLTYLWRVRTSTMLTNPTEADWSAWAVSSFKTPPASSSTITRVAPPLFGEVRTLTPTLTWANSNAAVFYYEVQVSRDFEFGPNAFLYSEYVHGGASTPPNSYVVPEAFPLEAGAIYYWRVRPRIQGDGDPLPWSRTNVFQTPG